MDTTQLLSMKETLNGNTQALHELKDVYLDHDLTPPEEVTYYYWSDEPIDVHYDESGNWDFNIYDVKFNTELEAMGYFDALDNCTNNSIPLFWDENRDEVVWEIYRIVNELHAEDENDDTELTWRPKQ